MKIKYIKQHLDNKQKCLNKKRVKVVSWYNSLSTDISTSMFNRSYEIIYYIQLLWDGWMKNMIDVYIKFD